jgi:hypothetical protein
MNMGENQRYAVIYNSTSTAVSVGAHAERRQGLFNQDRLVAAVDLNPETLSSD